MTTILALFFIAYLVVGGIFADVVLDEDPLNSTPAATFILAMVLWPLAIAVKLLYRLFYAINGQ